MEIFIATPMYGGACDVLYKQSMIALTHTLIQRGIPFRMVDIGNDALVPRARNKLAAAMLKTPATDLLFWDADTAMSASYFLEMMEADKEIIAAPVPKKGIDWQSVREALARNPHLTDQQLEGCSGNINFNRQPLGIDDKALRLDAPIRVLDQGTGVMLIKRSVLERWIEAYPDEWYYESWTEPRGDRVYNFFQNGPDKRYRTYLPEDFAFCRSWAAVGGEVWLAPWIKTMHAGRYVFQGNLVDIAECLLEPEVALGG